MRLDASSATCVQAGLVGAGLSPAASETPLLGFAPLRRMKVARVHRRRLANTGCGACPCRFHDFGGFAPRPTVPGFSPGDAHGVPRGLQGFPSAWIAARRRPAAPPDVRASRVRATVVGPLARHQRTSCRATLGLRPSSGGCPRSDPLPPPRCSSRCSAPGPDPLLTFVLLQGLAATAATRSPRFAEPVFLPRPSTTRLRRLTSATCEPPGPRSASRPCNQTSP